MVIRRTSAVHLQLVLRSSSPDDFESMSEEEANRTLEDQFFDTWIHAFFEQMAKIIAHSLCEVVARLSLQLIVSTSATDVRWGR